MSPSDPLDPAPSSGKLDPLAELEEIYRHVDREIQACGVVCWMRGVCCDFEKSDHVLYASSLELEYVRRAHPEAFAPGSSLCPFWKEGRCLERERRPLGCRAYHCDESFRDRTESLHEEALRRIQDLTRRAGVEWSYRPFVDSLRAPRGDRDPGFSAPGDAASN